MSCKKVSAQLNARKLFKKWAFLIYKTYAHMLHTQHWKIKLRKRYGSQQTQNKSVCVWGASYLRASALLGSVGFISIFDKEYLNTLNTLQKYPKILFLKHNQTTIFINKHRWKKYTPSKMYTGSDRTARHGQAAAEMGI